MNSKWTGAAGLLLGWLLALSAEAIAQEPAPGVASKVSCGPSGQYSYSCYLPKAYGASRQWPIVYCFAPDADGPAFVDLYKDVCEGVGWIVVASNDSQNGPILEDAIRAMWEDTHTRFSLAPKDVFATGWSGGARVANWFSREEAFDPASFRGLALIGGALIQSGWPREELATYLMCGEEDFSRNEMEQVKAKLDRLQARCELKVFPGGHQLPPREVARDAVLWLKRQRECVISEEAQRKLAAELEKARVAEEARGRAGEPPPPNDK